MSGGPSRATLNAILSLSILESLLRRVRHLDHGARAKDVADLDPVFTSLATAGRESDALLFQQGELPLQALDYPEGLVVAESQEDGDVCEGVQKATVPDSLRFLRVDGEVEPHNDLVAAGHPGKEP